jgi:hypothetical protein
MDILIRELDEICRESQELREQLAKEMDRSIWPERRHMQRVNAGSSHRQSRRMSDREGSS